MKRRSPQGNPNKTSTQSNIAHQLKFSLMIQNGNGKLAPPPKSKQQTALPPLEEVPKKSKMVLVSQSSKTIKVQLVKFPSILSKTRYIYI